MRQACFGGNDLAGIWRLLFHHVFPGFRARVSQAPHALQYQSHNSNIAGRLIVAGDAVNYGLMNILWAILIYLIMAAILATGVVLAVKGSFWLLILGVIGFVLAVTKIAILRH